MGGEGGGPAAAGQATFVATLMNVLANLVGAGLLSLPYTIKRTGLVTGSIAMLIVAVMNAGSMLLLARCCDLSKEYTYKSIAVKAFGPVMSGVISATLAFYTLGSCVAFAVLLGDFVPALICMDGCLNSAQRAFHPPHVILFMLGAAILYPLSLFRQLNALRHTSTLSAVCILYTAAMITARAARDHQPASDLRLNNGGTGIFVAFPILLVAYTMHYNVPKFYGEMASRTPRTLLLIALIAFVIVTILYLSTAISGYVLFADITCPDILLNFGSDDVPAVIARIDLSIIVIACFPLAFNALRMAVVQLMPVSWQDRINLTGPHAPAPAVVKEQEGGGPVGAGSINGSYTRLLVSEDDGGVEGSPLLVHAPPPGLRAWLVGTWALARRNWVHAVVTKVLVILAIVIALLVPNIGTVLSYKGAIGGSLVTYIFPVWMYFALVQRAQNGKLVTVKGGVEREDGLGDLVWEWRDLIATRHGLLATCTTVWGLAVMVCGTVIATQPGSTPPNCTAAQNA